MYLWAGRPARIANCKLISVFSRRSTEYGRGKITQIADAAVAAEAATGCPAELMAAQCILESGWLSFAPQNNCFGIKTYSGEFGRQLLRTTEWFNASELAAFLSRGDSRTATRMPAAPVNGRSKYSVQDWFATFATLAGCLRNVERCSLWGLTRPSQRLTRPTGTLRSSSMALGRSMPPIRATPNRS